MNAAEIPRIKICCIQSLAEAELAMALGVRALGLVAEMPSGPGVIPETLIAEIAAALPAGVLSILLSAERDPEAVIRQQRRCRCDGIQLCDRLPPAAYARLRAELPGILLIQSIQVTGPESVAEARRLAGSVDALLLDSGRRSPGRTELGGTGRTHDWALSRSIRETAGRPVLLAGGLNPANVAAAILRVRPHGVDVCTGVRSARGLDRGKLEAFLAAAQSAWEQADREEPAGS